MARLFSARTVLLGLAAGAAYRVLKDNPAVKGLLGSGGGSGGSGGSGSYTPPQPGPANVDVAGPPANTATAVPAPEPVVQAPEGGIDEEAEVEAAAAEAANIGGTPEDYPSEEDPTVPADEATRPLEEAGEGSAEGQELAEADLIDNAESAAGDPVEGERAVEEAIEAQDDPSAGESLEGLDAPPPDGEPVTDAPPPTAEEKSAAVWRIDEQPTVEAPAVEDDDKP